METFEDLGAVIGTVDVDSEALIGRAVVAGRRQQRRRRVGAGVGALMVGALVVGSGLHFAGSSGTDGGTAVASRTTASPSPSREGGRSDLPSAELTDARLTERLRVPGDLVSATSDQSGVAVIRTLDPDGSGTGRVALSLQVEKALPPDQITGAEHKCHLLAQLTGPESCRPITGGWIFTFASHPDIANAAPKALDWTATVVRKDGTTVQVRAANYVDQGDATRLAPVLTMSQVEDLATDQVWFEPAS